MPKKETLEDLAKREADAERVRAESRELYLANQIELAKHMPNRFFQLAQELREAVVRFNTAADPQKRITWRESAALAARDPNLNADFNLSFSRGEAEISLSLNALGRPGKPDVFLIEAHGNFPKDSFMLRVDGSVNKGKPTYRMSLNFKRLPFEDSELAERMVKALVKLKISELTDMYPG